MVTQNAFYAQSGGVTAVINATACGVLETARQYPEKISTVYAGKNGLLGLLHEELIDTSLEDPKSISALKQTPGGAFGSCRYKLKSLNENQTEYERLIAVFRAHQIRYFFYNGGNDSQETAYKVGQMATQLNYPLTCIGIPKTVDNDLAITDNCPGFGSVAKYVAVSILEANFDVASMASNSTKVFILEVMGRHAGWIAASSALAKQNNQPSDPPHLILLPEVPFDPKHFCEQVKKIVAQYGFCSIVASEGIQDQTGAFLAESGLKDAFGNSQLGGVAPMLAHLVKTNLQFKCHWAVSDYLQRSARHLASQVDVDQAYAVGKAAVEFAMQGKNNIMTTIIRKSTMPYQWDIGETPLDTVALHEKKLPKHFIDSSGFGITSAGIEYLSPLIQGEAYPTYQKGLPDYVTLKNNIVNKKLEPFKQK